MSWFESLKGSQDAAGGKFSQFAMTKSGAEAVKAEGDKVVTSMKENEEKWAFNKWTAGKAINYNTDNNENAPI